MEDFIEKYNKLNYYGKIKVSTRGAFPMQETN
jgi:hypothetical protein